MTLSDIIEKLLETDDSLCIVAKKPWSATSESMLVSLDESYQVPADALDRGFIYFLEVATAQDEVVSGWPKLTLDQRIQLLIFYAENDAFPDWVYQI